MSGPADAAGFDGKLRRSQPSMARWMLAVFALAVVYWTVCFLSLEPQLMGQVLLPNVFSKDPVAILVQNLPFAVALGLAIPFRLAERSVWTWVILIVVAAAATGFGLLVTLIALSVLTA